MSQNLKIRRSPNAAYRHIQKVLKNIVEKMLQKICYLATVTSNLSFLWASSWRLCSRVDFVSFSFCLLFHDARKNLSFQTNNLISENKIWWGNRENMQDLFQRISGSGKWTQKLNIELSFKSKCWKWFFFSII